MTHILYKIQKKIYLTPDINSIIILKLRERD